MAGSCGAPPPCASDPTARSRRRPSRQDRRPSPSGNTAAGTPAPRRLGSARDGSRRSRCGTPAPRSAPAPAPLRSAPPCRSHWVYQVPWFLPFSGFPPPGPARENTTPTPCDSTAGRGCLSASPQTARSSHRRPTHATPPFRLVPSISPDGPAPSLPNPLRYAGGSQLLRASPPARPRRYSAPRGFCRSGVSRTTPDTPAAASRRAFARSEREPRSRSCCLYAGPHLGSKRVSPRLIPRLNGCPGFEVTYEPFDTSTAEGSTPIAHLLDPHLTRSFAAPFPTTLSTTVAD